MAPLSAPVDLAIGRSLYGIGFSLAVHALAFSAAAILALGRPVFAIVAVLIIVSAGFVGRAPRIHRLRVAADGTCRVWTADQPDQPGLVRDASVYGALAVRLTIAVGQPRSRVWRVLLIADAVEPAAFRRLRVRLRLLDTNDDAKDAVNKNVLTAFWRRRNR